MTELQTDLRFKDYDFTVDIPKTKLKDPEMYLDTVRLYCKGTPLDTYEVIDQRDGTAILRNGVNMRACQVPETLLERAFIDRKEYCDINYRTGEIYFLWQGCVEFYSGTGVAQKHCEVVKHFCEQRFDSAVFYSDDVIDKYLFREREDKRKQAKAEEINRRYLDIHKPKE